MKDAYSPEYAGNGSLQPCTYPSNVCVLDPIVQTPAQGSTYRFVYPRVDSLWVDGFKEVAKIRYLFVGNLAEQSELSMRSYKRPQCKFQRFEPGCNLIWICITRRRQQLRPSQDTEV